MKIAYMIGSLHRGGTETLLLDVAMRKSVLPYTMLLVHRKDGELVDDFVHSGITCAKLAPNGICYLAYLKNLRSFLKKEHVDIVHAQYWLDCIYAWFATIGVKIPIVLTFHGYFLKRGWRAIPIRMAIRMADKVCFVSESEKRMFEDYYGDILVGKSEIIYNGINFEKFDDVQILNEPLPLFYKNDLAKALGKDSRSVPRIVMVGNFVSGRSQNSLCYSLKKLHDEGVQYEMYFVGRKSETEPWRMEECQKICENMPEVHFLGGRNDVPAILKDMDLCVYSTHHDTFGIAIIEPIAVGLPTVVNNYPVAVEVTNNGAWASLYRTADVDDCCEKIKDCMAHLSERKTEAMANKEIVRENYSIEKHIEKLNKLYHSL